VKEIITETIQHHSSLDSRKSGVTEEMSIIVSGLAKLYIGEIVETGKLNHMNAFSIASFYLNTSLNLAFHSENDQSTNTQRRISVYDVM
jgi:hypothetical protein